MPKRMRSLISNYLIINCDIQQPPKCLYLEHDQSMPLCYALMDPFVTSRMACKNEVGRGNNGNFNQVTYANSKSNILSNMI